MLQLPKSPCFPLWDTDQWLKLPRLVVAVGAFATTGRTQLERTLYNLIKVSSYIISSFKLGEKKEKKIAIL